MKGLTFWLKKSTFVQNKLEMMDMYQYLEPNEFVDCDHPSIITYTQEATEGATTPLEKLVALYYAVRDGFRYYPYDVCIDRAKLKASYLLTKKHGYCIEKSNLFAAGARILGFPSRLNFGNVRNHLGTDKLEVYLGTDVLVFHGCAEVFVKGKWLKATPVFNKELCDKFGVEPLDFNGKEDAVFQKSNKKGQPFMEYVHNYGSFPDIPIDLFLSESILHYPPFI